MKKALAYLSLTGLTLAATSILALGGYAQAASTPLPEPMDMGVAYEEFAFEAADTDGDDLISEGEFARDAAAAFSGLDANRDRKLTPKELGPHDPAAFAKVDANGDGVLTFKEVMDFKMKAFKAGDTNKDDHLSFDEMTNSVAGK